jgi:hypothetical protein
MSNHNFYTPFRRRRPCAGSAPFRKNTTVVGPVVSTSSSSGGGSTAGGSTTGSAISSTAWYNVVNTNSSLCVDASSWDYVNGTIVLEYTCGAGQANQEWQFQPTDSGYYQIVNRNALTKTNHNVVLEVAGGPCHSKPGGY